MDKAKLFAFIAILYAQEIEVRAGLIKGEAKGNDIKEGELYKLLKEAGYEPTAPKGTAAPTLTGDDPQPDPQPDLKDKKQEKKQPVILRHKTGYPRYRRAGLVLTQRPETYEVTKAQLAELKKDKWVVVGEGKEEGAKK